MFAKGAAVSITRCGFDMAFLNANRPELSASEGTDRSWQPSPSPRGRGGVARKRRASEFREHNERPRRARRKSLARIWNTTGAARHPYMFGTLQTRPMLRNVLQEPTKRKDVGRF